MSSTIAQTNSKAGTYIQLLEQSVDRATRSTQVPDPQVGNQGVTRSQSLLAEAIYQRREKDGQLDKFQLALINAATPTELEIAQEEANLVWDLRTLDVTTNNVLQLVAEQKAKADAFDAQRGDKSLSAEKRGHLKRLAAHCRSWATHQGHYGNAEINAANSERRELTLESAKLAKAGALELVIQLGLSSANDAATLRANDREFKRVAAHPAFRMNPDDQPSLRSAAAFVEKKAQDATVAETFAGVVADANSLLKNLIRDYHAQDFDASEVPDIDLRIANVMTSLELALNTQPANIPAKTGRVFAQLYVEAALNEIQHRSFTGNEDLQGCVAKYELLLQDPLLTRLGATFTEQYGQFVKCGLPLAQLTDELGRVVNELAADPGQHARLRTSFNAILRRRRDLRPTDCERWLDDRLKIMAAEFARLQARWDRLGQQLVQGGR